MEFNDESDPDYGALTADAELDATLYDFDDTKDIHDAIDETTLPDELDNGDFNPEDGEASAANTPEQENLPEPEISPSDEDEPTPEPAPVIAPHGNPLVAVCGTGGGTGTTTVTALMAFIAARQNRGPVLLTDLGGPSASLAAYFGRRAGYSLASAAVAHQAGVFGSNGRTPFVNVDRNLRLMAKEPDALDQINGHADTAIRDLLINSQEDHFATFIDCGRLEHTAEQQVASQATHMIWVTAGEAADARKARAKIPALGYQGTRLSILYVRNTNGTIPDRAVQKELGETADENGLAIVVSPPLGDLVQQGLVPTATKARTALRSALERILS